MVVGRIPKVGLGQAPTRVEGSAPLREAASTSSSSRTPLGPRLALARAVRKTALVGAVLVGLSMGSAAAQGAVLGAHPGAPSAGAKVELVEVRAEPAATEAADTRLGLLLAVHLLEGDKPQVALRKARDATTHFVGPPSSSGYLAAERWASAPTSTLKAWAKAHLAAHAAHAGLDVEALVTDLSRQATAPRAPADETIVRFTEALYALLSDDGIDPEAWRTLREKVMVSELDAQDLVWLRTTLEANNGTLFSAETKAMVRAFVEHPSPEFRKLAFDLEQPTISSAGAKLFLGRLDEAGLGGPAERAVLVHTLGSASLSPAAKAQLEAALAARPLQAAVAEVLATGALDRATWDTALAPNLSTTPRAWSEVADLVLDARMRPDFEMPLDVRGEVDAFLRSRGYPMQLPLPATAHEIRAKNVTAPDFGFEALMTRAGRDGELLMGFVDGGYDPSHPGLLAESRANPHEIPDNGEDDDENGYVDDHRGLNLLGLVDGKMDFGHQKQGHLRTGEYRGDAHGNHVVGVGTRGTDRIGGALVVGSAGDLPGAFDYLAARGATVINFSMGVDPRTLEETLDAIDRHPDVLFVHAAGNDGTDLSANAPELATIALFARPNVVHVAAADEHGLRLSDSNYSKDHVQLAAPCKHFSFSNTDPHGSGRFGEGMYHYSGKTSQAAPNAGNTAAKVRLLAPRLDPAQVTALLARASTPDEGWAGLVGAGGVLDAEPALALAATVGLVQDGLTEDQAIAQLELAPELVTFVKAALQDVLP